MKSILPVLLFGGLAYLIFSSAKKLAANLSFSFLGAEIDKKNTSISNIAAKITLGVQNDTENSAKIERVYLLYYYKGNLIGRTDVSTPFEIKPFTQTKILFPVNIPAGQFLAALGYSLTDLFLSRKNPEIEVRGSIFVSGGKIDVNEVQTFKIV